MTIRVTPLTGTAIDGAGNPNPTGSVGLHLLVPGGGNAIHTATGDLINRDPPNPTPDPVTAVWTESVIPPGDITPAGCEWQVSQGAAQPIISPSFAYTGSTINVTSWIGNPSRLGLLKMYLTAIEGNALIDAGATFGVTISGDATWTGTGGAGELVQAGAPPIATTVDSFGNVYYYLIPVAALTPVPSVTTSLFYQSPTRTGQLLWTCPAAYTDDQGTYAAGTTYDVGDVVRDPANNYEPYISLVGGNIGNTPSTSPTQWADYAGESITAHLTGAAQNGTVAIGTSNIAHDTNVPPLIDDPTQVPASLHDDLGNLTARIPGARRTITTSAAINAVTDDNVFASAAGGAIAPTLPLAVNRTRKLYIIKTDNVANVTITATGGNLINGAATLVLTAQYAWAVLESDGTNWYAQIGTGGTVTSVSGTAPVAVATGTTTPVISVPAFVASGASHAAGLVPDPGSTAGTTRYLREDATFAIPPGGGGGAIHEPVVLNPAAPPDFLTLAGDVVIL